MKRRLARAKTGVQYRSCGTIGRRFGVTAQAVGQWVRMQSFPVSRTPPWSEADAVAILKWRAETMQAAAAKPSASGLRERKLLAETRKVTAQAATAELELRRMRSQLLDAEQVKVAWVRVGGVVRSALEALPASMLPLALRLGMPPANSNEYRREAETLIRQVLEHLSHEPRV